MDIALLKQLGNMEQLAGVRESRLLRGRGKGLALAEFHNAAGLRFSVVPDRCMDLYDLSYRGINLAFKSKNGLNASFSAADGEFAEQWPGGMLVTCGLDNVGGHCAEGGIFPTHGRAAHTPALHFGTEAHWEGEDYVLRAQGEVHLSKMYSRHLSLRRTIETSLHAKELRIHDTITNFEAEAEPYMLLYHFNFGYPLLQADSMVAHSPAEETAMNPMSRDSAHMLPPEDGRDEELYLYTGLPEQAAAVLYNERLELGAYVAFDTAHLPHFLEWKNMKSHDYVLALEPCNTVGLHRGDAARAGKIAEIPAYSSLENHLTLGVLDGLSEIRAFLKNL